MIADLAAVRHMIDQVTPELRADMPTTATDFGNRMFAMFLGGMANLLDNDELPWQQLADEPTSRKLLAAGLRQDGQRVYAGLGDD